MKYVCTFTDNNCIRNVINVWLPTLKQNFSGKIVIITFNVAKEYIAQLEAEGVIVISKTLPYLSKYKTIQNRLQVQEEFIETLEEKDKIMLIDGADVVFQTSINEFFDRIGNKIIYSTTGTFSNKITVKWLKKLLKNATIKDYDFIMKKLPYTEIIASGMLAGFKNNLLEYFKSHRKVFNKSKVKYFTGINQAILTYLILKEPEKFQKTDIHNCRILSPDVIKENGVYKIHKTIPIVHFSCEKQKSLYIDQYLNTNTLSEKKTKPLNILWLYGSNHKFDKINHWYHLGFARILANKPNVNLMVYGYKMHQLHPDIAKMSFDEKKTGKDIYKEFPFDVIIMDNKNRFAFSQTLKERRAKVPRHFWLKPSFFDGLDNIPKVFLEGDYHLHFRMNRPEEKNWYQDRKVDLLLVRHLSALDYHQDKNMPIQWFPCSVNDQIFKPDPNKIRKDKICLISGYGINYYEYRNTAGKMLETERLADVYPKRFIGEDYINNLQSYICHLSGSSIRAITPAKMFEIMASGSVLFTDEGLEYGLKELFPDDSYVTYNKKTYYDVISKAKKIIEDKDFRKHLTQKALKCIKQKHTHEIRAQELLDIITQRFNLNYQQPDKKLNLLGKINKLFSSKPKPISYNKIEKLESNPKKTIEIEELDTNKNFPETNQKILEKLITKGIKVCILKDTCYDILLNNEIGNTLTIAVNDEKEAKKIVGDYFVFADMPTKIKKYIFKNQKIYIPYPIFSYLKQYKGDKIEKKFAEKENRLILTDDEYKFIKRH